MVAEARFRLGRASRFTPRHGLERKAIRYRAEARYQASYEVGAATTERLGLFAVIDGTCFVACAQPHASCLVSIRLHIRQTHLSVPASNAPNMDIDQMQQRYLLTPAQTMMADARVVQRHFVAIGDRNTSIGIGRP